MDRREWTIMLMAVCGLVTLLPASGWCQETRGSIVGRVVDPSGAVIAGAAIFSLLRLDFVARHVTPKRYWKSKIYEYQRKLKSTQKVELIKKIQLKKKLMTGDLDVAQDVILGINRDVSILTVESEVEQLKESVADTQRAEQQLELQLAEAKEKFNAD